MEQNLICISCPAGCRLTATKKENDSWAVSGNRCPRGEEYALQEMTDPRRVLTCLMRLEGEKTPVSVKSSKAVPKALLMDCVQAIYGAQVAGPVKAGDVLIENLLDTGADIIATRDSESYRR